MRVFMTSYAAIFITVAFVSCSRSESNESSADSTKSDTLTTTKEKTDSLIPVLNTDSVHWAQLPEEWEMITNANEEFIRYYPCDAANPAITINKKEMKINVVYGQDGDEFKIMSWKYWEEPYKDEFEYRYGFEVKNTMGEIKTFRLNIDKGNGVSGWSGVINQDGPALFVHKKIFNLYKTVKQPCKECFGDEECDD